FADALAENREKRSAGRLVVEVPDRIQDVLGERFSLAEICPYFYLDGKGQSRLGDRNRRVARDAKVDCLSRLGPSVLIITGYRDSVCLGEVITQEIIQAAPDLRLVVLESDSDCTSLFPQDLGKSLEPKLTILGFTLLELLRRSTGRTPALADDPH